MDHDNSDHLRASYRTTFTILISRLGSLAHCVQNTAWLWSRGTFESTRARKNVAGSFTDEHDISSLRRSIENDHLSTRTVHWLWRSRWRMRSGCWRRRHIQRRLASRDRARDSNLCISWQLSRCRFRATQEEERTHTRPTADESGDDWHRRSAAFLFLCYQRSSARLLDRSRYSYSIRVLPSHLYYLRPNSPFSFS